MTTVYFIRHGIPAERGTYPRDDDRPLVPKGTERTTQVAERLKALGIACPLALTSPLVQARQTAEILLAVGVVDQIETFESLAPDGDVRRWLAWLSRWQAQNLSVATTLALVGHQPDLSRWAQQLVGAEGSDWQLKKAGVIGLQVPAGETALGNSTLFWLVPPRLLL